MTLNLLIDCDPGHDDAVAILLANKLANLVSLTTVAGNTDLENTTRNALSLLELIELDIPVHAGAAEALAVDARDARHVHGKSGLAGSGLPEPSTSIASCDAAGHICEQVRAVDDLWLVAIGPLTNIALALDRDPALVSKAAGLVIMGGSTGAGNSTASAEFNIWADPHAAKKVFAAGFHPIICGLNLTQQFLTDDAFVAALRDTDKVVTHLVAGLYAHMHDRLEDLTGLRQAALHDPCAVLALTHPSLFEFEELYGDVETEGELTNGMTVFDQRRTLVKPAPNCRVATRIDAGRARKLVLDTLISGY